MGLLEDYWWTLRVLSNIEYKELCSSADPWGVPACNCN